MTKSEKPGTDSTHVCGSSTPEGGRESEAGADVTRCSRKKKKSDAMCSQKKMRVHHTPAVDSGVSAEPAARIAGVYDEVR